jgi:cytochrome c
MMVRALIAAAPFIAALAGPALAQDVEKGAIVFKKCALSHNVGPNATNKVGPELNGLNGRRSGSVPDFNYSDANKKSGIVWNEETFKEYIEDPSAKIPGTTASRASRRSPTCGSISSGSTPQVISRNSRMHETGALAISAVSSARR